MNRRLLILLVLVAVALATATIGFSMASFTSTSETQIRASASRPTDWVHLYSEGTDPGHAVGYAHSRLINGGVGTVAATGADQALTVDLGGFPDRKRTYDFPCVFSLVTPAQFPAGVGQITVRVTLVDDGNDQPLVNPGLTSFGSGGDGAAVVQLGPGQKYQFNVTVQARKKYVLGHTYWPHVLIDLSFLGVPDGYFRYDIPVAVTDIGGA